MTDKEFIINERIAILKGWRQNIPTPDEWVDPEGLWDKPGLPAWTEDKNLMLREKAVFHMEQLRLFEDALKFVLARDYFSRSWTPPLHMATAVEEAEALLMVLEGLAKP